jgi:hypothetical protein
VPVDVVTVERLEHLRLRVTFRDGLSGEVVFRDSHLTGVFEPLRDPGLFAQVRCDQGFVSWPGELDLAPDAMYAAIKERGIWELN